MRTAIYMRVSTKDRQTTEHQLRALMTWAEQIGANVVRAYEDRETGASRTRPGLAALLAAAERGEFKQVLIVALDRLSREGILATHRYLEAFTTSGVRLRSLGEPWLDTDAPTTALLVAVFAWVAKMERERLGERTRRALATARAHGRHVGRPFKTVPLAPLAAELRRGSSISAAARRFGVSRGTIRRVIREAPAGTFD